MARFFAANLQKIDWVLFLTTLPLLAAGLATMHSFTGDNSFALHQLLWIAAAIAAFFAVSMVDVRFLRLSSVSAALFIGVVAR